MNMIENHMEQIALSAAAISELPFPPPKIFTNALLHPHDITALIRDTEAHERALFKVSAPEPGSFEPVRRKSVYFGARGEDALKNSSLHAIGFNKPNSAVGRILGGDLVERIKASEKRIEKGSRAKGEVDVELLLKGAEKLCGIYPIPGIQDRIESLRARHEQLTASIARYESKVARQTTQLDRINHPGASSSELADDDDGDDDETQEDAVADEEGDSEEAEPRPSRQKTRYSAEDLDREEAEMRELEAKKRTLEERVSGMEKDLGGLKR